MIFAKHFFMNDLGAIFDIRYDTFIKQQKMKQYLLALMTKKVLYQYPEHGSRTIR